VRCAGPSFTSAVGGASRLRGRGVSFLEVLLLAANIFAWCVVVAVVLALVASYRHEKSQRKKRTRCQPPDRGTRFPSNERGGGS